jgi:hypothetical protein
MRTIGVTAGASEPDFGDLAAVEHVLQAIPQRPDVPRIVLHLVDDAVVLGRGHRDRGLGIGLAKRREVRLAGFQARITPFKRGISAMLSPLHCVSAAI